MKDSQGIDIDLWYIHAYRVHGDTVYSPRSDLFKGGGDDAEHPTVISMYTFIAHQAPSGPTGLKVNPLLFKIYTNIYWTWSLPHLGSSCITRYEDDRHQAVGEHPGDQGEGPQGHKDEEGVQQDQLCTSQATPCARATQRAGAGAPCAHGPVPCPRDPRAHGPNLPRVHGPPRMAG